MGYTDGTTVASYAYDALDRRIAKVVDGGATSYVYDMSLDDPLAHDDIILEYTGANLTRRWVHSASVDEPVGFEEYTNASGVGSGAERAMFADRQGSVIWVTDPATGAVVAAYEYDGYGQITQTQGTLTQPYGYTSREYDAESGLYYYRARAYDPAVGMFVQEDPIGFGGGTLSLHQYVSNDPFNWSDPEGLMLAAEWRNVALAGAATTGLVAWNSGVFGSTIGLANQISAVLSQITPGTWEFPMSEAGPASEPPNGDDPCKGPRNQLRTHIKKFEQWVSDPLSMDNQGMLSGNPIFDMFVYVNRSISLRRQVMQWTYRVKQCEKEHEM